MNPESPRNRADHLKGHRWGKGRSGNPGGRPRGASIRSVLQKVLAQKHNGRSYYQLLGDLIYREAMKGRADFVREILDRVEGRPGNDAGPPMQTVVFNIVEAKPPPGWGERGPFKALPPGEGDPS